MSGFAGIQVDDLLLRRAQSGAADAYEALYRLFSPAVYTVALRIVGQPAKAEDVLQDTFIEVMRSIARFRGDSSLATWIRHIAVSKALMLLRTAWERNGESLDDGDDPPGTESWRADDALDLDAALARLEPASRAVVWLHDVEGYTHREIGELTGQTESFSKSRLARAHQSLRDWLEPEPPRVMTETVTGPC